MSAEPAGLATLLGINVADEIRKLGAALFDGPWQLPAELARRALRAGASRVDVAMSSAGFSVGDDGPPLTTDRQGHLACLADRNAHPEARHAALVALERAGETALVALASALDARITCRAGELGTRIDVAWKGFPHRRARSWLRAVGRFCEYRVFLDRRPLTVGFQRPWLEGPLAAPLTGRIAVHPTGSTAHVHLLEHGLVSARVALPGAPPFEATLELGSTATRAGNAEELRGLAHRSTPGLLASLAALLATSATHLAAWPFNAQARLAQIALALVDGQVGAAARLLESVGLIPAWRAGESRHVLLSLHDLRALVLQSEHTTGHGAGRRHVAALHPWQRPRDFALGPHHIVPILDEPGRRSLGRYLDAEIVSPPALVRTRTGWRGRAATLAETFVTAWGTLSGAQTLPASAWTEPERKLLEALGRTQARPVVVLCAGHGPIRARRKKVFLPRENPTVRAAVSAVNRDPGLLYPAACALLADDLDPPADLRQAWRRRVA